MRIRILASATAIALAVGLLTATSASAAYTVQGITFPGGSAEFYSPFGGPATIEFGFLGSENNATFNVRIRPANGNTIYNKDVFVTPDEADGTETETFSWPPITVSSPKEYIVSVHRSGTTLDSQSFFLHPRLVRVTDIAPDPFFPWVDDGYRDTTTVRFTLAQAADAEVRIFRSNSAGNCCGSLIRDEDLGDRSAGPNTWAWDGKGEGEHGTTGFRPKGSYFVRVRADDGVIAPAVSKPFKVRIERTYRATATKSKPGTQFHHTSESALVRGGDCFVHNLGALQIDCHGAKITVFYRWGLNASQRIEKASFVIDNSENECGPSRRKQGHTKHESFLTVTDAVSGITSCPVVTAKITYSFPKAS
jgi:hypothetical protein